MNADLTWGVSLTDSNQSASTSISIGVIDGAHMAFISLSNGLSGIMLPNTQVGTFIATNTAQFYGPATFSSAVSIYQSLTVENNIECLGNISGTFTGILKCALPDVSRMNFVSQSGGATAFYWACVNPNLLNLLTGQQGPVSSIYPVLSVTRDGIIIPRNLDVTGVATFAMGVTMAQSLDVTGNVTMYSGCYVGPSDQLKIYGSGPTGYISSTYGELVIRSDTDDYSIYIRGMTSAATVNIVKPKAATLSDDSLLNRAEGDARWAKVRTDLTDAQYTALADKDATTFYIASDTGKIYLGTHAFN